MAEQPQIIIETPIPQDKAFGARKQNNLQSIFPQSPVYTGELSDQERKQLYEELALNGDVASQGGPLSGPGHGVNSYSRDFVGTSQNPVPDLSDVETGGGGLPASPFIPNLTSPGAGSVSATDQPAFDGDLPSAENNIEFGSGLGGTISPKETSERISEQSLGNYISGRSYLGSDGKS